MTVFVGAVFVALRSRHRHRVVLTRQNLRECSFEKCWGGPENGGGGGHANSVLDLGGAK